MAFPRFDPTHAVNFDFGRGSVRVGATGPSVLVPADALAALCKGAGADALRDFGRRVGTELGRRLAERLGRLEEAPVEGIVEHLGAELALAGLGSLGLERWGRALVLRVTGSPFGAEGDPLLAAVLEGALQRATSRDPSVVALKREDELVRFAVLSAPAADKLRGWLAEGSGWGDALTRLQAPRGDA